VRNARRRSRRSRRFIDRSPPPEPPTIETPDGGRVTVDDEAIALHRKTGAERDGAFRAGRDVPPSDAVARALLEARYLPAAGPAIHGRRPAPLRGEAASARDLFSCSPPTDVRPNFAETT
jgi:hypothetical protein